MERFEQLKQTGEMERNYTKKERLLMERELIKMRTLFEGIKDMRKLPEAIIVFDVNYDEIALVEAQKSGVKIIGIVDTNCNPDNIQYVIPANDDAIKAIEFMASALSGAISEGKKMFVPAASMVPAGAVVTPAALVTPETAAVAAPEAEVATEAEGA